MISSSTASLLCVVLFSIGLTHSSPSLFGTGNIYVGFSLYSNGSATLYELNLGKSLHVSYLSWGSFSNDIVQTALNQTTGDAILYGKAVFIADTKNYFFNVTKVFVVIPDSTAPSFDAYFTATTSEATTLNIKGSVSINNIDVELGAPFLDLDWVNYRITTGHAVIQGYLTSSSSGNTLVADRVFISLPDQTVPCFRNLQVVSCPSGETFTYNLTPNRCLVPQDPACVHVGPCPLFIPFCPPPFFLFSFPSKVNGCNTYYCFPEFVNLQ